VAIAFLFLEPSTRTKASFWLAAKELDIDVFDVASSAMEKGESIEDTLRTLETLGFDAVVMRVPWNDTIWAARRVGVEIPIIDAGSGVNSHPTQALADIRVMERFKLVGKPVAFLGDAENSRVYHSLKKHLDIHRVFDDVDEALEWGAKVLYCLRPQKERGYKTQGKHYPYVERKHVIGTGVYIMHAGPYTGVEFDPQLRTHLRVLMDQQVRAGVEVRKEILSPWSSG
jgi:aspartate carbamoyltransferase catalytic subunit